MAFLGVFGRVRACPGILAGVFGHVGRHVLASAWHVIGVKWRLVRRVLACLGMLQTGRHGFTGVGGLAEKEQKKPERG